MKNKTGFLLLFFFIIILSIFFSGCKDDTRAQKLVSNVTWTPEVTLTPIKEYKETEIQINFTATALPQYSIEESLEKINGFEKNNGDCAFPCVWGMTPGITSLEELKSFLYQLGSHTSENFELHNNLSNLLTSIEWKDNLRSYLGLSFYLSNGLVENVTVCAEFTMGEAKSLSRVAIPVNGDPYIMEKFKKYQLATILSEYGIPDEVLLLPFPNVKSEPYDTTPREFSLVLVYGKKGFFIEYILPYEVIGDEFKSYPSQPYRFSVVTWDPTQQSFEEALRRSCGLFSELSYFQYKPLEEATSMTVDQFYQEYKKEINTSCITTKINVWPDYYCLSGCPEIQSP